MEETSATATGTATGIGAAAAGAGAGAGTGTAAAAGTGKAAAGTVAAAVTGTAAAASGRRLGGDGWPAPWLEFLSAFTATHAVTRLMIPSASRRTRIHWTRAGFLSWSEVPAVCTCA